MRSASPVSLLLGSWAQKEVLGRYQGFFLITYPQRVNCVCERQWLRLCCILVAHQAELPPFRTRVVSALVYIIYTKETICEMHEVL